MLRNFFGLGTITTRVRNGKSSVIYSVKSLKSLNEVIIPHFKKYPLLTKKNGDFILFSSVVKLMIERKHLDFKYLVEIISIKASMNGGLSNSLKTLFPEIKKVERPVISSQVIESPLWLIGFIQGEGCFFVKTKWKDNKVSQILLTFSINQHSRDLYLMNIIRNYLDCGKIEKVINRPNSVTFVVYKFSDILEKVIPLFESNPILGVKSLDFNDFCKVSKLIENKLHLTNKGLHEIINIKKGMNIGRKL